MGKELRLVGFCKKGQEIAVIIESPPYIYGRHPVARAYTRQELEAFRDEYPTKAKLIGSFLEALTLEEDAVSQKTNVYPDLATYVRNIAARTQDILAKRQALTAALPTSPDRYRLRDLTVSGS